MPESLCTKCANTFSSTHRGVVFSHQFIFTDHHQGVKELRNIMHKSVKVPARNDKVVFYVSQISGWKTYCSERLKFQGCWFERFRFLLIFNEKQVKHFDAYNLINDRWSSTSMKRLIRIVVFFLSFLNCPGLSFAIPHSQHVSSNLECADRRKAYFLSPKFPQG